MPATLVWFKIQTKYDPGIKQNYLSNCSQYVTKNHILQYIKLKVYFVIVLSLCSLTQAVGNARKQSRQLDEVGTNPQAVAGSISPLSFESHGKFRPILEDVHTMQKCGWTHLALLPTCNPETFPSEVSLDFSIIARCCQHWYPTALTKATTSNPDAKWQL